MPARSTSSRSTSSFSTSVRSRSNGPWKTSRSRSSVARDIAADRLVGPPDGSRADAHQRPDLGHRLLRDGAGALGAHRERPLDALLVGAQLAVALPDGAEHLDER